MPRSTERSSAAKKRLRQAIGSQAAIIPGHVAIIMHGNGRWAREQGKTRLAGHRAGAATVREIVEACAELGVEVLTLYAFSAENWDRPKSEVRALFALLKRFLRKETPRLVRNGIALRAIGRTGQLPAAARRELERAREATAGGERMTLCLALNYGAQDEIVDAARSLAREAAEGELAPDAIDRSALARHLSAGELPPVDLLIRTGGEFRVSNFMLWQISYAELVFSPACWPDFDRKHLLEAFDEYARRERRFGGLRE